VSEPGGTAAFTGLVDLASERIGGRALLASDDFFAPKENLLKPGRGVWEADRYTERGKWMDGWESRRRRTPGHDWCIVALGVPGAIRGVDIDTNHFTGNHAPFASLDACNAPVDASGMWLRDQAEWVRIVEQIPLQRGSQNLAPAAGHSVFTHVRLNIYPDGGVARLRVFGEPQSVQTDGTVDLACANNGGRAVACNDAFFCPMDNLLLPGPSTFMGGGWETRRSRPRGTDWIVVRLGHPGLLENARIETHHFKGNFPDTAAMDGLYWPDAPPSVLGHHPDWTEIVFPAKLRADEVHHLPVSDPGPFTHIRMRIVPDGGISRLRVFGTATDRTPADDDAGLQGLNGMSPTDAAACLSHCCGSTRWVAAMVASRPFTSRTHLHGAAEQAWWHLDQADWHEAFTHHPRIGADREALREKFGATAAWAQGEQSGVAGADETVLEALAEGNAAYQARFGYIFIVCATGLAADEMLARLRSRLDLEPQAELRVAAGEQAKITAIRIDKLLEKR
jgi:allantoicase